MSETVPIHYDSFQSIRLGTEYRYLVYLPPSYEREPDRRYPVVFWLHGANGHPPAALPMMLRLELEIARGNAPEMIVASADGLGNTWWCDTKDGSRPAETVLVKEMLPRVESHLRTVGGPDGRAVEGFSMGGFGAAHIGFRYPDLFRGVSVFSGALHTPEQVRKERAERFEETYGGDMEYCVAESPWTLAEKNADAIRQRLAVRINVGESDALRPKNEAFSMLLGDLGIAHTFGLVGSEGHRLGQLYQCIEDPFGFYAEVFATDAGKETKPTINIAAIEEFAGRLRDGMLDRELHGSPQGVKVLNSLVEEFRKSLEF